MTVEDGMAKMAGFKDEKDFIESTFTKIDTLINYNRQL